MPSAAIASLAKKAGKSEGEVEKAWSKAKKLAHEEYPDLSEDDDRFWAIVTGITKKMLGLKESIEDDKNMITEAAAFIEKLVDMSGKSEPEVEKVWYAARKKVANENPDMSEDDDEFWKMVLDVAKEMLGVNESKTFSQLLDGEIALVESLVVEAQTKFKVGDRVKLTLKGLQQFNRGRMETAEANKFSRMLGKLYDDGMVGEVEHVFPSGSMNVRFGSTVYDIKPYMVEMG